MDTIDVPGATYVLNLHGFHDVSLIGYGSNGLVFRAAKDGKMQAIKMQRSSGQPEAVQGMRRELTNHNSLNHINIVRFNGMVPLSPARSLVAFSMELALGGSLKDHLRARLKCNPVHQYDEGRVRSYMQQLVSAVDYCHRKGVVVRDIKPGNILLTEAQPGDKDFLLLKLADFGWSKDTCNSAPKSLAGSLAYLPPEIFTKMADISSRSMSYSAKALDVWCCGIVLCQLLTLQHPFAAAFSEATSSSITPGTIRAVLEATHFRTYRQLFTSELNRAPECLALLDRMLEPNPRKRATISGILSDPWLRQGLPPQALQYNTQVLGLPPQVPLEELMRQMDLVLGPSCSGVAPA